MLTAPALALAGVCDLTALPADGLVLRHDVAAEAPRTDPLLEIDADGSVRLRNGGSARLTEPELSALMARIARTGIGAIAAEDLPRTIPAGQAVTLTPDARPSAIAADAPVSFLDLRGRDCGLTLSVYALAMTALRHPENGAVQALRAVERDLLALAERLQK